MRDFLSHNLPHLDHESNHCRNLPEHHCMVLHLEISKWKRKFQVWSAIALREISNQILNFIHCFCFELWSFNSENIIQNFYFKQFILFALKTTMQKLYKLCKYLMHFPKTLLHNSLHMISILNSPYIIKA